MAAENPERRADAAILCWGIGVGLLCLAWVLGLFGSLAAAFSLGSLPATGSALAAVILAPITIGLGLVFCFSGFVWMIVRAVADQAGDREGRHYSKNVER